MLCWPDRLALLIDGSNLHATAKAFDLNVEHERLLEEFQSWGSLVRGVPCSGRSRAAEVPEKFWLTAIHGSAAESGASKGVEIRDVCRWIDELSSVKDVRI